MSEINKNESHKDEIFLAKPRKNNTSSTPKKIRKSVKVKVRSSEPKPNVKEEIEKENTQSKATSEFSILDFSTSPESENNQDVSGDNGIINNITFGELETDISKDNTEKTSQENSEEVNSMEAEPEVSEAVEEAPNGKKSKRKSKAKKTAKLKRDKSKKDKQKKESHSFKKWYGNLKFYGKIYVVVLFAAIIGLGSWGIGAGFSQSNVDTTFYQVKSDKVSNNVRAVVLSDLHLKEFGENNSELISKVKSLKPDIIVIVGDMVNENDKDYSVAINLCKELVKITDVYYSYGNNESSIFLFRDYSAKFKEDLFATGVTTLDNKSVEVKVGDTTISIGGFSGGPDDLRKKTLSFLDDFTTTSDFTLLLCHQPEVFLSGKIDDYPVDLALCGHTHGGQVILPYLGGLYTKNQGFLPEYDFGEFDRDNGTKIIISRGLGTNGIVKRFNNRPEIVVTDINWY